MTNLDRWKWLAVFLIVFGIIAKFYDLNAPWKTNDHYNFGGVATTSYAECLKLTPLSISKGIPHTLCWDDTLSYYQAHPPTILFAMWGWTSIFGSQEWSYRLFILFFSTLSIGLIFLIAREARPGLFSYWAAAFQSVFLGNIYFGTHPDFIGEFTVFFVLLTALTALRGRITLAGFMGLLAGISAWPGYIVFAPLWLYTFHLGRGKKRIFAFGAFGFIIALATMMWLHQNSNVIDFLRTKLLSPGYVHNEYKGWTEPFSFARNFVSSQARLLSPLFCAFAFFELLAGEAKLLWRDWRSFWRHLNKFHWAVILSGGTGAVYAIIGHEYFMVHIFLYLLFTPGLALLCARFIEEALIEKNLSFQDTRLHRYTWVFLCLLFAALYPYGIYKSNAVHDAANSVLMILIILAAMYIPFADQAKVRWLIAFTVLAAIFNVSQMINYRNEKDTERSFCEKARAEFHATNHPVVTKEPHSDAKELLYCTGIPLRYVK